jgi:hypothetical protein
MPAFRKKKEMPEAADLHDDLFNAKMNRKSIILQRV